MCVLSVTSAVATKPALCCEQAEHQHCTQLNGRATKVSLTLFFDHWYTSPCLRNPLQQAMLCLVTDNTLPSY
jgi:hypothetical protein